MARVVIVGGGISGLVAAYAFTRNPRANLDVTILEPGRLGGEFLAGGLKYIHRTDRMIRVFNELRIPYSNYFVAGGILLQGQVRPYPACLEDMDQSKRQQLQRDHYVKTRQTAPGPWSRRSMNDPASTKPKRALRADAHEWIEALAKSRFSIVPEAFTSADKTHVHTADGCHPYDFLVFTIPLWLIRQRVWFYVPHGVAMRLNIALVQPARDRYVKWDYVYTPYTPADYIHRFSSNGDGYMVEANGELDQLRLQSDLNFIFPDGYFIEDIKTDLKGHIIPLRQQPEWPDNVAPIGRYAQWDPRATADVAMDKAIELVERWTGVAYE